MAQSQFLLHQILVYEPRLELGPRQTAWQGNVPSITPFNKSGGGGNPVTVLRQRFRFPALCVTIVLICRFRNRRASRNYFSPNLTRASRELIAFGTRSTLFRFLPFSNLFDFT